MPAPKLHIELIYGSAREGRFCDTIAKWTASEVEKFGRFSLGAIDPRTLGNPAWPSRNSEGIVVLKRQIDRADAFIVATPEYNHGYTAALKLVIDAAKSEWRAKPVAFVSYGGISGGLRAVEQLRLIFAELHMVTIRDTVSFANAWNKFDADRELLHSEDPEKAMAQMLMHLEWWASVLHDARKAVPYTQLVA